MRRALYASGGVHAAVILWVAFGGSLFRPAPDTEFEVTGVTLLSVQEFESLTSVPAAAPAVPETPIAPIPAAESAAPELEPISEAAPDQTVPEETLPPEPDPAPEPVPPIPETVVADEIAALPSLPLAEPDLPVSPRPTPRDAPRVAPQPAPVPEPDVETAPEVVDQPTDDTVSDMPTPETPPTAPEEATTEIVTEAEEPAAALSPGTSPRPPARPARPAAPVVAEAEPELDPAPPAETVETAIAGALAEALSDVAEEAPAPVARTPTGPPLSAAVREGFRIAVGNCWNVGSLSSEAQRVTVVVGFDMSREGVPETGTLRLVDFDGGSREAAQQAYEAARRAILRCGARGYDLPIESYDRWSEVELVFNPNGMRLR